MTIVLDTTILIRANEHSHGLARELLISVIKSNHSLLVSNEILHELAKVPPLPTIAGILQTDRGTGYEFVGFVRQSSQLVILNPMVLAHIRDVNDIVELAQLSWAG